MYTLLLLWGQVYWTAIGLLLAFSTAACSWPSYVTALGACCHRDTGSRGGGASASTRSWVVTFRSPPSPQKQNPNMYLNMPHEQ